VSGYDPAMVRFLADRIAGAVLQANSSMMNARAAWGTRAIWDLTKNRSEDAFDRNPAVWRNRFRRPLGNNDVSGKVDSTLAVLRVDLWDAGAALFRPAGAFTVFAIHGTGNPSANELFDGDIQALAARVLETRIDAENQRAGANARPAVHLVANGAEGDVAPAMRGDTRCWVPTLARVRRPTGPHSPPGPELWIPPRADSQATCILRARAWTDSLGARLGAAASAIFDSLGTNNLLTRDIEVGRVFSIVRLTDTAQFPELCRPQSGVATLGGADDGYTRYRNWKIAGMHNVGFNEDSAVSARARPEGCQALKRPFLGRLQRKVAAKLLPEHAQITVARIGNTVLSTVPFEATTIVGGKIREAALQGANRQDSLYRRAILIGLVNGYNQYVATEEEYRVQHYEGASTLFGPRTAERLVSITRALAQQLPANGQSSPPADVLPINVVHYGESAVLPAPDRGPEPGSIEPRTARANWRGDTLFVRWTDLHPGRLIPADAPVLELQFKDQSGNAAVLRDGDASLEIWSIGPARGNAWQWEARWRPKQRPAGNVEVVLLARPGLSQIRIRS
jgi:neutral ceramidase